jgi:hypothetical protein
MSELMLRKMRSRGIASISISSEVDTMFKSESDKLQIILICIAKLIFKPSSIITYKNVTCSYRYKKRKLYIS